jgi:hypothetical protein
MRPVVVSVFAPSESKAFDDFSERLARVSNQHGWHVLQVTPHAASLGFRPLFRWEASKPLMQQTTEADGHAMLFAPGCLAGEGAIVQATADSGKGLNLVLFGDFRYSPEEAALDETTSQTLILLVDEGSSEACHAFVKAVNGLPVAMDILLAGAGASRVAQAVQRFLKLPVSVVEETGPVWLIRHATAQTSSNTLSGCPDLPRYVARILNRRGPEAKSITSYAS